eukprot:1400764-Pleurochrysis_carterae.AAC.1
MRCASSCGSARSCSACDERSCSARSVNHNRTAQDGTAGMPAPLATKTGRRSELPQGRLRACVGARAQLCESQAQVHRLECLRTHMRERTRARLCVSTRAHLCVSTRVPLCEYMHAEEAVSSLIICGANNITCSPFTLWRDIREQNAHTRRRHAQLAHARSA